MNYRAVIFDLDGVLCHTDRYHYLAWKALADRLGIPFDEAKNDALRGVSRRESLDILLGAHRDRYTEAQKSAFCHEKNEAYRGYLEDMTPDDIAGAVWRTLAQLQRQGTALAIGSSSKNAPLILEKTTLGRYFPVVVDGNQIVNSKPDPEVFLLAAGLLRLPPKACLVVEDAAAGVQAAKQGGFAVAYIGTQATRDSNYTITEIEQIINIVKP